MFLTQVGKTCAYTVGQSQVAVAATGGSGTFAVTTTCDVVVPAPAVTWVSAFASESAVVYFVEPNPASSPRATTIAVGTAMVTLTQPGGVRLGPVAFTDPTITAGMSPIRATHVAELRSRIAAVRAQRGLAAFIFTDTNLSAGMPIRRVHITELRTALLQIYAAISVPLPSFTDPDLGAGSLIKGVHLTELRAAIIAIE